MSKNLLIAFMCLPLLGMAQGIKFEEGLSWEQVKAKANAENKFIFVDAYASWCVPCKQMDKQVYLNDTVGNYTNDKFLSVKVQMDTSKQDKENIQKWYADASSIKQQYKVNAFPTFLFFSPEGKIVHREEGYKNIEDFIGALRSARDASKQYYTLLENYQQGNKDYSVMSYLAITAKSLNEKDVANAIALDFKTNYLDKLKETILLSKENLDFIGKFQRLINSKDGFFNLFYYQGDKVDQLKAFDGYSQLMVDYVITKEEITPKLYIENNPQKPITNEPKWSKITSAITKKYGKGYAERTVLEAQINWYKNRKAWSQVAKYNIKKIEKYGLDTSGMGKYFLNNMIWDVVFLHSNDKTVINKAIKWMEIVIKADPNNLPSLDTYANLLYKAGRTNDAIEWEEKAAILEEANAARSNDIPNKVYRETLEKMRKGEPTWPKE